MNTQNHHSSVIKWTVISLIAFIIALIIFRAGMVVGYRQASFNYGWGTSYYRTFVGRVPGFVDDMLDDRPFFNDHGAFGQIIKMGSSTIVVHDQNDGEKVITFGPDTVFKKFKDTVKGTDLSINQYVVVIGSPDATGTIKARLIRIVPPPPTATTSPSTK